MSDISKLLEMLSQQNKEVKLPKSQAYPQPLPLQYHSQPKPQFNQLDFNCFHQNQTQIIKHLMIEQERVESDLFSQYDIIQDKFKSLELKIRSEEISGGSNLESLIKERNLVLNSLKNYERHMQETMEQLVMKQQQFLQEKGFPMFKVTNELEDLVNQHWVLAPYVSHIKSQSKSN